MAKFSKQHYQVLAGILLQARDWEAFKTTTARQAQHHVVIQRLAEVFADVFETDNTRFDREHFLAVVRGERPVNSRPPH